jgi:hypothetical protein
MTPHQSSCLNCETPFQTGQLFCARCGQKTGTRRMTLHDIGHDLLHALTHADHSVFSLVRELALRPGVVTREYVDGRRKKYFNPFSFLIIVVGVASLLMASTRFVGFAGMPDNPVSTFLVGHLNLIILGQVPLLAMFTALLFRSARRNFAEHLVLAAYTSGYRSIFFTLVILPVWWVFKLRYETTVGVYVALWLIYFGVACAQFHPGHRGGLWFKGLIAGLLAQLVTTGIIAGSFLLYFASAGVAIRPGM